MFPTSGSEIYRNEEGEVLGWSNESSYEPEYCDICGFNHPRWTCSDPATKKMKNTLMPHHPYSGKETTHEAHLEELLEAPAYDPDGV